MSSWAPTWDEPDRIEGPSAPRPDWCFSVEQVEAAGYIVQAPQRLEAIRCVRVFVLGSPWLEYAWPAWYVLWSYTVNDPSARVWGYNERFHQLARFASLGDYNIFRGTSEVIVLDRRPVLAALERYRPYAEESHDQVV